MVRAFDIVPSQEANDPVVARKNRPVVPHQSLHEPVRMIGAANAFTTPSG